MQRLAEEVPVAQLAERFGTPLYVYSRDALESHYTAFDDAFGEHSHRICYAVKANSNLAVLNVLARCGAGFDIVSGGELERVLRAGGDPDKIVFSGVGKTAEEIALGLDEGIMQFNVESLPELELLSQVATSLGVTAEIAIRINPDVDAKTHAKISTGKKENKFGVDLVDAPDAFRRAAELPGIEPVSIAVHIGSQLTDLAPYRAAFERVAELTRALQADGIAIAHLDLGGGLGIPYDAEDPPPPDAYARMVKETVGDLGLPIMLEPGRLIVGNAGVLLSRALFVKPGREKTFLILDAAMNDLIRPAMYDAWHDIVPVREPAPGSDRAVYDIVGPVCESGDTFAKAREMPELAAGDLVAFRSAGAYGAVMASEYNTRPLVPEVLVKGDHHAVIRARPTFDEMISRDTIPEWLRED